MDQRSRLVGELRNVAQFDESRKAIKAVLDEAQNEPPEGEADGSICEAEFNAARAVEHALDALSAAMDAARVEFKR